MSTSPSASALDWIPAELHAAFSLGFAAGSAAYRASNGDGYEKKNTLEQAVVQENTLALMLGEADVAADDDFEEGPGAYMPVELLLRIFEHLPPVNLLDTLASVCKLLLLLLPSFPRCVAFTYFRTA